MLILALLLAFTVTACATAGVPRGSERIGTADPSVVSGTATAAGTPSPEPSTALSETSCQGTGGFEALPAGAACWIEIVTDDTPIRVSYTIPGPGWAAFIGTFKDVDERKDSQRVAVLIADIKNVTVDACEQPVGTRPPVGPSVRDLAVALAALPPFEVSSPAEDVTLAGYSGTHLQLRVPLDQPFNDLDAFIGCDNSALASWIAPPLSFAFYGYTAPGETEDFWILDVDGTRVVISALATANASDQLIAERQAILDSIDIEH
ncbi:MAG: hypothetical protein ACR2I5_01445 [Candidatus Limnocylindria bacterium]